MRAPVSEWPGLSIVYDGGVRLVPWRRPPDPAAERRHPRVVFSGQIGADGLQFSGLGLQAADALLEDIAGLSSSRISRRDAFKATAILRARNLIAGVCATLPIELRDRERNIDDRNWVGVQPDDTIEDTVHYASTFEDLLFEGTSYWRVTRRGADGFPVEAEHLDHRSVSESAGVLEPSRIVSEDLPFTPGGTIYVDGRWTAPGEVIRFTSPNPPLLVHAGKAIRTLLLLDKVASEYAANPLPFGYFKDAADEEPMDDDEIRDMLSKWERARRERMWGYVESGLDLNMLEWPSPQQLQLIEARNHAVLDIARATGLDPEDLATVVEGTSRTYSNQEQRRLDLIDFTLMPFLSSVQDRLSMNDICPRGLFAKFRLASFAHADTKSRYEAYKIALEAKFMTVGEVRRAEDWPELTAAQKRELAPKPAPFLPGNGSTPPVNGNEQGNGNEPVPASNGNGVSNGNR